MRDIKQYFIDTVAIKITLMIIVWGALIISTAVTTFLLLVLPGNPSLIDCVFLGMGSVAFSALLVQIMVFERGKHS